MQNNRSNVLWLKYEININGKVIAEAAVVFGAAVGAVWYFSVFRMVVEHPFLFEDIASIAFDVDR